MSNDALPSDRPRPTGSRPPTGPPLPPGLRPLEKGDPARVGPYRLVGRIGAGGMGAVYGALDDRGHRVAVKTVHARFARRARYREAFAREVRMLARARGVSTARLHAADAGARVPWLAFDYVPGRDLRAHVRAFGPLTGDMLRAFAAGTAEGLAALHAAGIAHRDIKPGNVILAPEGPKIVDFGIATEIGADRATDRAASYGTPGWVAPERFAGVTAAAEADVFAWGALVALAAIGRDPYGTGTPEELRRRAEAAAHDVDGVPDSLRPLVERALSPDPAARPRAVELMRALLPPPEEVGETGRVPAERTLAAMLRAYWRGVDDAGHDPARWAAALGLLSAVGVAGGLAVGTGAGTVTGTGTATGAGAGAAGGSAAAAGSGAAGGTGVAAAGAQMAAGSSAAGGAVSALAGSKVAAAGAGLLLLGGVATGGYVVYDQLLEPREAVAEAARILEEGQGFSARVERSYTTAYAEEIAGETGESVESVMAESAAEEEYLYSSEQDAFLIRGAAMGEGTVAVADHGGRLFVYGPAPGNEVGIPEHIEFDSGATADDIGPALLTGPMRAIAESDDLGRDGAAEPEGADGNDVYSGSLTSAFVVDGEVVAESAEGLVEVDPQGVPTRMQYDTDRWRVRVDFTGVGEVAEPVDPQRSADVGGQDLTVLHGPVCGRVEHFDLSWDVRVDAWEMDCDYAMDITGLLTDAPVEESDRVVFLSGYSGSGQAHYLFDGGIACRQYRSDPESFEVPDWTWVWNMGSCFRVEPVGEIDRMMRVEYVGPTLIEYFRVE